MQRLAPELERQMKAFLSHSSMSANPTFKNDMKRQFTEVLSFLREIPPYSNFAMIPEERRRVLLERTEKIIKSFSQRAKKVPLVPFLSALLLALFPSLAPFRFRLIQYPYLMSYYLRLSLTRPHPPLTLTHLASTGGPDGGDVARSRRRFKRCQLRPPIIQ